MQVNMYACIHLCVCVCVCVTRNRVQVSVHIHYCPRRFKELLRPDYLLIDYLSIIHAFQKCYYGKAFSKSYCGADTVLVRVHKGGITTYSLRTLPCRGRDRRLPRGRGVRSSVWKRIRREG